MAKKKEESNDIFPNGAHFGVIQLPRDLDPKPAAQRIVQWVNNNGKLNCYISENAYHRVELKALLWKLMFDDGYATSIARGAATLLAIKGRIHWHRFTAEFCQSVENNPANRINPETDEPETSPDLN